MADFCTLFDSNYLARGMALYQSLQRVCSSFHLYVVTFDQSCFDFLQQADLQNLTAIRLEDFEDQQLLAVKPGRKRSEYCWTCTPSVILYCIEKFKLPACTYLDADMIFYQDPQVLIDEDPDCAVLITSHRYTTVYDQSATHGTYCVQFMYFRKDPDGLLALRWWRDRCLEWCYDYQEDGKFGDQKYLDDWTKRFKRVHELAHLGGGVAPWNLQQYEPIEAPGQLQIVNRKTGERYPLVFFHFHGLTFYTDNRFTCTGTMYRISTPYKNLIYFPYVKRLLELSVEIRSQGFAGDPNGASRPAPSKWEAFRQFSTERLILLLKGKFMPYQLEQFDFSKHFHISQNPTIN